VSGYFNPLHVGHIEYFQRAKDIAGADGELIVIVNNDAQSFLKKGSSFMKEQERVMIVKNLRMVDHVILSVDVDRTVCRTLASIVPPPTHFCNGGDQNNQSIPEARLCHELGIVLVDELGEKIQSSSWLLEKK
jgi:cytidyltransferase-like protein